MAEEEAGYDVEFVDSGIPRDLYECSICQLAFRNPYQLKNCGHRFCKACIEAVLDSRTPLCPVDRQPFSRGTIYEDIGCRRTVLSLRVYCPQKEGGCSWKGELGNVEDHNSKCRGFTVTCCNSGCNMTFPRLLELEHKSKCLKRLVNCGLCEESFPITEEEKHKEKCTKEPIECELCGQMSIPRDEMDEHIEKECENATMACPYHPLGCDFTEMKCLMDGHLEDSMQKHLALACAKVMELSEQNTKRITRRLSQKCRSTSSLETIQSDDHPRPTKTDPSRTPYMTYVWKIGDVMEKINSKTRVKSEAYFTGPNSTGYRFFVYFASSIDDDDDDDKNISVYIRLARSASDCLMSWPFRQKLYITIVHPKGDTMLTDDLGEDRDNVAFQRPVNEENKGIGFADWLKLSELKSGYIENNSVVLKIEVEPTAMLTSRFA